MRQLGQRLVSAVRKMFTNASAPANDSQSWRGGADTSSSEGLGTYDTIQPHEHLLDSNDEPANGPNELGGGPNSMLR